MKTVLRWSGAALALVLLQITLLPQCGFGSWTPDLCLIATALVAFRRGRNAGQLAGFAYGLLQGLFATVPFGAQAFALTVAGFLAGSARHLLYRDNPFAPALFALPAALLVPALVWSATQLAGYAAAPLLLWQPLPLTFLLALAAGFLPWPAAPDRPAHRS